MKKTFFLIAAFCFIAIRVFSQDKKTIKKAFLNLGVQTTLAVGDLAETHGFGVGANVQGGYHVTNDLSLTARVSYTHLFGKKFSYGNYEPGGGGNYNGRYDGMNDFGFTGGVRYDFPGSNLFTGLEGGACVDSGGGHSETAGEGSFELGYGFHCKHSSLPQALAILLGICGDPKIQIGLRYSIRL